MPYETDDDLPAGVRHMLPEHAQDIHRAAFSSAWSAGYAQADEAAAHRIAWAAVKRRYRNVGDAWVPNR